MRHRARAGPHNPWLRLGCSRLSRLWRDSAQQQPEAPVRPAGDAWDSRAVLTRPSSCQPPAMGLPRRHGVTLGCTEPPTRGSIPGCPKGIPTDPGVRQQRYCPSLPLGTASREDVPRHGARSRGPTSAPSAPIHARRTHPSSGGPPPQWGAPQRSLAVGQPSAAQGARRHLPVGLSGGERSARPGWHCRGLGRPS